MQLISPGVAPDLFLAAGEELAGRAIAQGVRGGQMDAMLALDGWAHAGLQGVRRDEVHLPALVVLRDELEAKERVEGGTHLEVHQNVEVAVLAGLVPSRGANEGDSTNAKVSPEGWAVTPQGRDGLFTPHRLIMEPGRLYAPSGRPGAVDEMRLMHRMVCDPRIFGGKPIIRGHRLTVEHVLACLTCAKRLVGRERVEPILVPTGT
jgi:hypothetical protein